jgi:hypothetical protein
MNDQIRSGESDRAGGNVPFNKGGEANPSANPSWALGITRLAAIELDAGAEPNFFVAPSD